LSTKVERMSSKGGFATFLGHKKGAEDAAPLPQNEITSAYVLPLA
jgi:hypothetical protein